MIATTSPLASPVNHVFVDYENVHQVDLSLIGAKVLQTKIDELIGKAAESADV